MFTSSTGRLIPCIPSGFQLSSRGGTHSEKWPGSWNTDSDPGWRLDRQDSGCRLLTMARRCPVLSVLVVHTLCYILVRYKWWSICRTSTPLRDHLMSRALTVGRNIPEVVRKTQQRCFRHKGTNLTLFILPCIIFYSNNEPTMQHYSVGYWTSSDSSVSLLIQNKSWRPNMTLNDLKQSQMFITVYQNRTSWWFAAK